MFLKIYIPYEDVYNNDGIIDYYNCVWLKETKYKIIIII